MLLFYEGILTFYETFSLVNCENYFLLGWVIEDTWYFNTTLKEYKEINPDGTSNNITKDDFDCVQVIAL